MKKRVIIITILVVVIAAALLLLSFTRKGVEVIGIPDKILISTPQPNALIESPLNISGRARGVWFFESSFPVYLFDDKKNLLATATMQAQGEWMTEEFVPFKGLIDFEKPSTGKGYLVFKKENPSGLPEYDEQFEMAVKF